MQFKRFATLSVLGLATALTSSLALAQDPPLAGKRQQPKSDDPQGEDQRGEGQGRRGRRGPGGPGGPGGFMDPQRMVDNLNDELSLTPEQQKSVKEIIEKRMNAMRNPENLKPEDRQKLQEIREKMREAREAGDRDEMRELGQQMREIMGDQREQFQKSREEMRQEIRGVLTPDQQKKYDAMPQMGFGRGRGGPVNPRILREAAMRLELGTDQKARIEAIFEKARDAEKNLKRDDRQARAELNRKLHDDVVAALTPEQAQQLERHLQRANGGQRGNRGEGRPGRPGRGGPQGGRDQRGGDRDDNGA